MKKNNSKIYKMAQPSFALPDQLCYDLNTPSDLGTNVIVNIVKSGSDAVFDPMKSLRFK